MGDLNNEMRHHVHHSYIWLGSLRAILAFLFVLIVANISMLAQLFEEFGSVGISGDFEFMFFIWIGIAFFIVVCVVVVAIHALSYRFFWYEVGSQELSIDSGIFIKKHVHIPYLRIQTVDQKASLLQRIFGVCNLSIDTAGGANNKSALIPYLTKDVADQLRRELYARKQAIQNQAAAVEASQTQFAQIPPDQAQTSTVQSDLQTSGNILDIGEEVWQDFGGVFSEASGFELETPSYQYGLSNKELLFTGLSNSTGFVIAVLTVCGIIMQIAAFAFDFAPSGGEAVMDSTINMVKMGIDAGGMASFATTAMIAIFAFLIATTAIIVWIISVAATCIQYGGFHARRYSNRIEVERGLLQHRTESLDLNRIQSIIVRRPVIRRIFGYCEICLGKVSAQGEGDASSNNENPETLSRMVIHPFVKLDQVESILQGMLPEMNNIPETKRPVAKVAFRRGLIRRCVWQGAGFWTAISVLALQLFFVLLMPVLDPESVVCIPYVNAIAPVLYIVAAVLLVFDIIGTVLWYRESAFDVNHYYLRINNGGLSCTDVVIPRQKIQYAAIRANPLQRLANTATLQARTAAGVGGTTVQLVDITSNDANLWLDWMVPNR